MTSTSVQLPEDAMISIEKAEENNNLKTIFDIIQFISADMGNPDNGEPKPDANGNCNDDWMESAEASLDAFYRMIKSGIQIKTTGTGTEDDEDEDNGIHIVPYYTFLNPIFGTLNGWRNEESIVEVALGCIVAITTKMIEHKQEDMSEDDLQEMEEMFTKVSIIDLIVVKIMKELYANEPTIQEQACLAIEGLALSPYSINVDLQQQLRDHIDKNIIQQQLRAARDERITNERNKAYPERVAKALLISL